MVALIMGPAMVMEVTGPIMVQAIMAQAIITRGLIMADIMRLVVHIGDGASVAKEQNVLFAIMAITGFGPAIAGAKHTVFPAENVAAPILLN